MKYNLDDIDVCECIGEFEDEYVYDVEVDDDTHTFIANDILVHNSLYISYADLLKTIEGSENMSIEEKTRIIIDLSTKFVDAHNNQFISEYYSKRFVKSIHEFELETLSRSGCWLDTKKRYAQILLWKDGKFFDQDNLPLKVKGLEMVKASYPKCAREILKKMTKFYLENDDDFILQKLNIEMQKYKREFFAAPIEDICGNININGYAKYIIDDTQSGGLVVAPKCPSNVRAAGTYNQIRNTNKLPGEPIYGGKCKVYMFRPRGASPRTEPSYFAFRSMDYPQWADEYAPVDRNEMFQHYVLDPFNRIIESNGVGTLKSDGSIQMNLFDF